MKQIFPILCVACAFFYTACANITPLQGGEKDNIPPKVDTSASTPFGQTKFSGRQVTLRFNEWIKMPEPQKILFSPPLKRPAQYTVDGKNVVVRWTDTLRADVTYSINFGKAVIDFTEGNPAQNLRFVFSTGAAIDTLQLKGAVVDALTATPAKDVLVQIYDTSQDSVVRKQLPNYFAITDETGHFTIENIKAGAYKVIALKDINGNYKYDEAGESIAFLDEMISLPTSQNLELQVFEPEKALKIQQIKANTFGRTDLVFTRSPKDVRLRLLDNAATFKTLVHADTLTIWHRLEGKQTFLVDIPKITRPDTARFTAFAKLNTNIKLRPIAASAGGTSFRKGGTASDTKKVPQATLTINSPTALVGDTLTIDFARPLSRIELEKIILRDSSKRDLPFTTFAPENRLGILHFIAAFKPNMPYTLQILPNALSDDYGITNDSIFYNNIKRLAQKELGTVIIKLKQLDKTKKYLVELTDANQKTLRTFSVSDQTEHSQTIPNLPTGNYGFRLITDENGNGQYDTGDYYTRRQPENIMTIAVQALRANWELELTNTASRGKTVK